MNSDFRTLFYTLSIQNDLQNAISNIEALKKENEQYRYARIKLLHWIQSYKAQLDKALLEIEHLKFQETQTLSEIFLKLIEQTTISELANQLKIKNEEIKQLKEGNSRIQELENQLKQKNEEIKHLTIQNQRIQELEYQLKMKNEEIKNLEAQNFFKEHQLLNSEPKLNQVIKLDDLLNTIFQLLINKSISEEETYRLLTDNIMQERLYVTKEILNTAQSLYVSDDSECQ